MARLGDGELSWVYPVIKKQIEWYLIFWARTHQWNSSITANNLFLKATAGLEKEFWMWLRKPSLLRTTSTPYWYFHILHTSTSCDLGQTLTKSCLFASTGKALAVSVGSGVRSPDYRCSRSHLATVRASFTPFTVHIFLTSLNHQFVSVIDSTCSSARMQLRGPVVGLLVRDPRFFRHWIPVSSTSWLYPSGR